MSVYPIIHFIFFVQIGKFTHGMKDGWGLATDGKVLFGTDGSSSLYHLDPKTFKGLSSEKQLSLSKISFLQSFVCHFSSKFLRRISSGFAVLRNDVVRYKGYEVHNLNELEYVNGEVWANIWMVFCVFSLLSSFEWSFASCSRFLSCFGFYFQKSWIEN